MFRIAALVMVSSMAAPASAVVVTYEAGGVTNTTLSGAFAVEDFSSLTPGLYTSVTDPANGFSYTSIYVNGGDVYGGAGGSPYGAAYGFNLVGNGNIASYQLTLPTPKNYFGLYITAADTNNSLTFTTSSGTQTYSTADFFSTHTLAQQASYTTTTTPSNGPLYGFFANFDFGSSTVSAVTFAAAPGTGFESDNHTIGSVPEPLTWGMMVVGFGAMGATLRRRRMAALSV